jgi:hypothetical protein
VAVQYLISRGTDASTLEEIGTSTERSFIDTEELPDGVEFFYAVRAELTGEELSPLSDPVGETAVNVPPVAANDTYFTDMNVPVTIAAAGVLANDTQDDDSPLTSRRVRERTGGPAHGTLTLNENGSFTYTPNAGFFGEDHFSYTADNGRWSGDTAVLLSGPSNAATVTIHVIKPNVAPVCSNNATATVITGGSVTLTTNCTDEDNNPLTVTAVGTPSLGTAVTNGNATFTYTATSPNVGTDTFTYTVSDGTASATGTAVIKVVYGFVNVQNLPPSGGKTFNPGSAVPVLWRWTNIAGVALNSSAAGARVDAYACSTSGALPPAFPTGSFTPELPGSGNSFAFSATTNTWQFNWKTVYTSGGTVFSLPKGTYVLQIKSNVTGQLNPETVHNCGGTPVRGALLTLK